MSRQICVVQTGEAVDALRRTQGDYDQFFVRHFQRAGISARILHAHRGESLRTLEADALVITGSRASMVTPEPWMQRLADDVRRAAERGTPVLGVCFGHQLLGHAFGVGVTQSPWGREIGTVPITLTAEGRADSLFAGFPETFFAQATHQDEVARLPPGARALATNRHSPIQAMALGAHVRGVQFHPELDVAALATLTRSRATQLRREGRLLSVFAGLRPSPLAHRVLDNFVAHFVSK